MEVAAHVLITAGAKVEATTWDAIPDPRTLRVSIGYNRDGCECNAAWNNKAGKRWNNFFKGHD